MFNCRNSTWPILLVFLKMEILRPFSNSNCFYIYISDSSQLILSNISDLRRSPSVIILNGNLP